MIEPHVRMELMKLGHDYAVAMDEGRAIGSPASMLLRAAVMEQEPMDVFLWAVGAIGKLPQGHVDAPAYAAIAGAAASLSLLGPPPALDADVS